MSLRTYSNQCPANLWRGIFLFPRESTPSPPPMGIPGEKCDPGTPSPLKGKNNGVGEREEPGWTGPIAPAPCPSIPSPTLASLSHFLPPPRKRVRNLLTSRGANLPDAACPDGHLRWGRHNALPLGTRSHPHAPSLTYRFGSSSSRQGGVRLNPPIPSMPAKKADKEIPYIERDVDANI